MHPDISTFAARHGLSRAGLDDLERLVARLRTGGVAANTLASLGDFDPVLLGQAEPLEATADPSAEAAGRYDDLGSIGSGGMGEVRRVRDRELNRVVALKRMHAEVGSKPAALARFVEEAQATAQLQHPNIVPVYDAGVEADGRPWFTMKEVRGRSMSEVIREVHAKGGNWTLRRVIAAFLQVCNAVAYAHARGVVHRDLKPENVMLGTHGEVYVVDWGLAKILGRQSFDLDGDGVITSRASAGSHATQAGAVSGTPVYMAPEQALGKQEAIGPLTDVYGLGAVLYEVLSGRVPVRETALITVLVRVASGDLDPLDPGQQGIPEELVQICTRAMAVAPEDRFPSAEALAEQIEAWLDGARRRDRALQVVRAALALDAESEARAAQVAELRRRGRALLAELRSWSPEAEKAPGWALLDQAQRLEDQAALREVEVDHRLQGALQIAPELPEAHAALAERYRSRHAQAEAVHDPSRAGQASVLLGHHARALPERHPVRLRSLDWLAGDGALTLESDPAGAEVFVRQYETHNRRLVLGPERSLGTTPLHGVPLPMGSYRCEIRHPQCESVLYPVHIGRQVHWDGRAPGAAEAQPIPLPPRGSLGALYVPAGWFQGGGDPQATRAREVHRTWLDGFAIDRFAVTNRQYIAFLDDLVAGGDEEAALRHAPRDRGGSSGEFGTLIYGRDDAGLFVLQPDADGDVWKPEMPVCMVDWHGARAFLAWRAARTGLPWRLPRELEWEKAARGVDGRRFPWGDCADPAWCYVQHSLRETAGPEVVDSYPVDESPYGARGMSGNVADWCFDRFDGTDAPIDPEDRSARTARGGAWDHDIPVARTAARHHIEPMARHGVLGFRGAYSLPSEP